MGSLTCAEMRQLENDAFKQGATAEGLMEKVGHGMAQAIVRRYPVSGVAIACIGSGNNGGDALVVLRYLAKEGWNIAVKCLHEPSRVGALPRKKWRELGELSSEHLDMSHVGDRPLVILDGLLGIGASGPLRAPLDALAAWMNTARENHGADVIAMDIPSGMNGDTGEVYEGAVIADLTLTVGVPKTGLFSPLAVNHTGAIESVPLEELPVPDDLDETRPLLNDLHSLRGLLPRRPHDFHKGDAGRVGILAGSRGMLGAAVLCAQGALKSGAGLVTLFIDESLYTSLAPMLPPEVMLKPIRSLAEIDDVALDTLAIGPGIGLGSKEEQDEFFALLKRINYPVVLDADGLNRIARDGVEKHLRANMILTPHPGEMARLFPDLARMPRLDAARAFSKRYPGTTLLLKGSHSLIAESSFPLTVNGTGHAGMASGGQGDVLTGVIAGLLGQKLAQRDAARLGAWLCGRAAELAVSHGRASQQSLTAGDVPLWLGAAFRELGR